MTEIDLTPITRLEYDIDAILNDHAVAEPITRIELILADIVAGNTTTVVPVTRIETFLAIISGADYPAPEPVTRIETFLAIIAGEDYEEPEAVTRLEGLLAEWVEKGSGIWKTVTGTRIHITDALASPMQKCEVTLEPIQDLHGQDAPYPAGGGKNIADIDDFAITANVDQTVAISDTITLAAGTYTLSYTLDKTVTATRNRPAFNIGSSYTYGNDIKTAGRGSWTFTLTEESTLKFYWWEHTVSQNCNITDIQLESGSTATPYAPYSNICPITGWTGALVRNTPNNLCDPSTVAVLGTATISYDGNTDSVSVQTTDAYSGLVVRCDVTQGKTYTFSCYYDGTETATVKNIAIMAWNNATVRASTTEASSSGSGYLSCTYTATNTEKVYFRIYLRRGGLSSNNFTGTVSKILAEESDERTEYKDETLSVTFPDTVYGGKYEFVSGNGTSRKKTVDASSLGWVLDSSRPHLFGVAINDSITFDGSNFSGNILCSAYKSIEAATLGSIRSKTTIGLYARINYKEIYIYNPNIDTAQDFKTSLSGQQICYELATPTEITLTPQPISTLAGENNVWGDGTIELTYKAQA